MRRILIISLLLCAAVDCWAGSSETKELVEPFDRGIGKSSTVFIPKGTIGSGVNFSYNTVDLGKADGDSGYSFLFDLVNGLNGSLYTFGLAPHLSYFVADNLSLGARVDYERSSVDLGNASLSLGEDMGLGISDYHTLSHTFSGSLTLRYYMAIADSKRFAIFAEARATGAYGQSKTWKVEGDSNYGSYHTTQKGAITFVPGICIFAQDNVAVEVAIGILGINYTRTEQVRNQVEHSVMQTSGANFRINPLSIEIGTSFYFYTGPHSKKARKNMK